MTDPDARLRDLLEQAAPGSPALDPTSRTAAVVRRGRAARRRDRGLLAGATAVVLALAVGLPLAMDGEDGAEVATPPAATTAACPSTPIDVSKGSPDAGLADVVSVRSCPVLSPAGGDLAEPDLPTTPLTGDTARDFAADVLALPQHDAAVCAAVDELPRPWALVVGLPDGGTEVIGSTLRTCGAVAVGGVQRTGQQVLDALTGNLERQQSGDLEPGADGPTCPAGDPLAEGADTWNASFDIASATAGMICYVADPMGSVEYAATEGKLHLDTLATIRDDLARHLVPRTLGTVCADTGPQRLLVLTDDEGDRAAYADDRCSGSFSSARGQWKPSAESEAAIAEALGGALGGALD
ncbi:hypothetical protein [Nocardioides sp. 503]|uniref:hypothetical protein n=1 Tax=Nocardioides sp. 503 TaxID=2508326 RepID=UPI0010703545|nr:hypothetical protein [Nocardioides sp. 503]